MEAKNKRPSWDEYFMKIAFLVAERSTCRRRNVGAVIVNDRQILSTGYNGAGAGLKDCLELGCLRDEMNISSGRNYETCRAIHAEQNAVVQAARYGVRIEGATVYCTHSPCILCAKMLVNARIKRFVSCISYPEENFRSLFEEANIEYVQMEKPE